MTEGPGLCTQLRIKIYIEIVIRDMEWRWRRNWSVWNGCRPSISDLLEPLINDGDEGNGRLKILSVSMPTNTQVVEHSPG